MNCETARQAISALLDSQDPAVNVADLDAHLANCSECLSWKEAAHRITRLYRLQPADKVPAAPEGLVERLSVGSPRAARARLGSVTLLRAGLGLIAAVQLAVFVPLLIFGHDHDAPVHVAHEMGSFDVAIAVGFIVCALRPSRALGMLALVAAAAALLLVTAGVDLAQGRTDLADEAPHLLVLAGWLIIRRLAAISPPGEEGPISAVGMVKSITRFAGKRVAALHPGTSTLSNPLASEWSPTTQTNDPQSLPAVGEDLGTAVEVSRRAAS